MSLLAQAERFFSALNAQDLDEVVAAIDPSANIHTPIGSFTGGEAYREWMLMPRDAGLHPRDSWHRSRVRSCDRLRAARHRYYDWPASYAQWRYTPYRQKH